MCFAGEKCHVVDFWVRSIGFAKPWLVTTSAAGELPRSTHVCNPLKNTRGANVMCSDPTLGNLWAGLERSCKMRLAGLLRTYKCMHICTRVAKLYKDVRSCTQAHKNGSRCAKDKCIQMQSNRARAQTQMHTNAHKYARSKQMCTSAREYIQWHTDGHIVHTNARSCTRQSTNERKHEQDTHN